MRGLLTKEFLLLKGRKKYLLLIFALTIFLSLTEADDFAINYLTFLCGFLAIGSVSYDDNGNCMPFLLTLPVSRKLYVWEKYVFGALVTAIGWTAGFVITGVTGLVEGNVPSSGELIMTLVWLPFWLIVISLSLPPVLKYGTEKGRIALFAIVLILVAAAYAASKILEEMGIDIAPVTESFSALDTLGIVAAVGVLALIAVMVSCTISVRIVQKKEY